MPAVYINILAVIVAALANMVIGMIWYNPKVMGSAWMKEVGLSMGDLEKAKQKGMALAYVSQIAAAFVMAYVLAHILDFAQADTLTEGLQGAFWCWLGFIATSYAGFVAWEGRSWKWYAISSGYMLLALLVNGAILVSWV